MCCGGSTLTGSHVRPLYLCHAKLQVHQVCLELAHQCISRRSRWWCLLLPAYEVTFQLENWPVSVPVPCVGDVVPEWPVWPQAQEQDLLWDAEETAAYFNEQYGQDTRLLAADMQAATVLHSYGNPLRACPCGCRQPFAEHRLRSHGLRGCGVLSQLLPGPRYLQPRELCLLNTVLLDIPLEVSMREALCLIGQLAAPMQSLWIGAQLQRWIKRQYGSSCLEPLQRVQLFKHKLCCQHQDLWLQCKARAA